MAKQTFLFYSIILTSFWEQRGQTINFYLRMKLSIENKTANSSHICKLMNSIFLMRFMSKFIYDYIYQKLMRKSKFIQILSIFILLLIGFTSAKPKLTLGTGGFGFGCGSNSPAAQLPFSFVRLGPDTIPLDKKLYAEFQHYGGYSDSDHAVQAFSHMHLVGAGVIDMGIFGILPLVQKSHSEDPPLPPYPHNLSVPFSKEDELWEPGYYSTLIPSDHLTVELTSSQRCGAHRYTYFNKKNRPLNINIMTSYLLQRKSPRHSMTRSCGEKCLEGQIWVGGGFGGRFGGYNSHFHLEWVTQSTEEPDEVFLYTNKSIVQPRASNIVEGNHTGAIIRTNSHKIELYMGISYVSIDNARQNFEKEVKGKNFDQIRQEAQQIWKNQLQRFNVVAINEDMQTKIDTAIYRTLLTPTIFEDHNGQYVSFKNDGTISTKPENMEHVYTDMSLWDVHRSQMPWLLFHDPYRFKDVARSLLLINQEGGYMPKWPFAQGATGCMIGAHANTVLSDWVMKEGRKSLSPAEMNKILEFMMRNANNQTVHDSRSRISDYLKYQYIPYDDNARIEKSSCSETLEYSYNDFGISQVAGLLNKDEVKNQFLKRSKFYQNVWNPKSKFFEPRNKNGTFVKMPAREHLNIFSNYYVEGDAWHYRFYAPHDAKGLIKLFGGDKDFVKELEKFFARSFLWKTFWLPNPYYWAGNEHDLFSVWLFPFAGRSDLTQKYSRAILDEFYGTEGNGLPGNDDYATMSAWLIFSALGFYPLPSTETYILGSPYIHYAKIMRRVNSDEFTPFIIRVEKNSKSNIYVREVVLNGKKAENNLEHSNFVKNSYLHFEMWNGKKQIFEE